METRVYVVPGMHSGHCETAVIEEVSALDEVESVVVDLETKHVVVQGVALDDAELVGAKLLQDHVNHCVAGAIASGDETITGKETADLLDAVQRFVKTR